MKHKKKIKIYIRKEKKKQKNFAFKCVQFLLGNLPTLIRLNYILANALSMNYNERNAKQKSKKHIKKIEIKLLKKV